MEQEKGTKIYDCSRGCDVERTPQGALNVNYNTSCCKLNDFNWMVGISQERYKDLFEVRFKNTRKIVFKNTSGQLVKSGDLVVVEAQNGHDVGIVTLEGPIVVRQLARHKIDPANYEFRKIYRRAKILDIERWQEAIAREHKTMIRARQIAAGLGLNMKIGDVEFQGDGTKAIFYYIADERVDFRQLIKDFAEEFRIKIEMKQIGARQEAGLIGGLGVCGRPLCCSRFMADFQSITTQAARCQDLSLNPQKLAGQCSKLKCCVNYEASLYIDAQNHLPQVKGPLEFNDGQAYLMKSEVLKGLMYFSYDPDSMANLYPLSGHAVKEIIAMNRKGIRPESIQTDDPAEKQNEFISAVGDDSISRFDDNSRRPQRRNNRKKRYNNRNNSNNNSNNNGNKQ
ncbi:MAG: regulatory iron-sulfur-containing complex subunit RicT [Bacteroidales bacterium]|nr:regulatory iron-sulfur-containing complex subunit RicT [Bacteroidales bacterium]